MSTEDIPYHSTDRPLLTPDWLTPMAYAQLGLRAACSPPEAMVVYESMYQVPTCRGHKRHNSE